jgi:hypothetical protein
VAVSSLFLQTAGAQAPAVFVSAGTPAIFSRTAASAAYPPTAEAAAAQNIDIYQYFRQIVMLASGLRCSLQDQGADPAAKARRLAA